MKPTDALKRDWSLYYSNTWMRHSAKGAVRVQLNGDGGFVACGERGDWQPVAARDLVPLWVRPGAYNTGTSALYIARRARRSARRSCGTEHYIAKWKPGGRGSVSTRAMWAAINDKERPSYNTAKRKLREGHGAVAISHDMIIANSEVKGTYTVILRGENAGSIVRGVYHPPNEYSALIKMARVRLQAEGVRC